MPSPLAVHPPQVPPGPNPSAPLVGVFDSGVGGLSVVRALREAMPHAELHYIADSGHAPYGDREPEHVLRRSTRIVSHLVARGAGVIVIACNTATALAIDEVRRLHPGVAFIGVEPGVKPAAMASRTRAVAVMATPATLASARYADLVQRHAGDCTVHPVPCAGLAAAIEQGGAGRAEVERLLDLYCAPVDALGVDTVVLGCTHYPFIAARIQQRFRAGVCLLDTAPAVARRASEIVGASASAATATPGALRLETTGEPSSLSRMAHLGLGLDLASAEIAL